MANHKFKVFAELSQLLKNRRSRIRTFIKKVESAIEGGNVEEARTA